MGFRENNQPFDILIAEILTSDDLPSQMAAITSFGRYIDYICKALKWESPGSEKLFPIIHHIMLDSVIQTLTPEELQTVATKLDQMSEPKILDTYKTALPPLLGGLVEGYRKNKLSDDFTEKEMIEISKFRDRYHPESFQRFQSEQLIGVKYDELLTLCENYQAHLQSKIKDGDTSPQLEIFNSIYHTLLPKPNEPLEMVTKMKNFSSDYQSNYHDIYKEPSAIKFLKAVGKIIIIAASLMSGLVAPVYLTTKGNLFQLWKPEKDKLADKQNKLVKDVSELDTNKPKPK